MRLLCIHQNFPGQFRDLAPALVERGHELRAISNSQRSSDPRIPIRRYALPKPERSGIHGLTAEVDEWIRRSELVAREAEALRLEEGWAPDVILAHPGWGESLLLKEIFPSSPLVLWPELWLGPEHMGSSGAPLTLEQRHYLRTKNGLLDVALAEAAAAVLPTAYQASTFPQRWQTKLRVIHEGIQAQLFEQHRIASLTLNEQVTLGPKAPVVTFISRNLEPMRGFPLFMRALPQLQTLRADVQVVIVGGDEVSYSAAPDEGGNWRQIMLKELEGKIDLSRIHFFGRLPHPELVKLYRRSDLHVYLSEAFVLSWSLTEVLACGTPVLARANPMLAELIRPGVNGTLWEGAPGGLGKEIARLLEDPEQLQQWGRNARDQLLPIYHHNQSVDQLELLLEELSSTF